MHLIYLTYLLKVVFIFFLIFCLAVYLLVN